MTASVERNLDALAALRLPSHLIIDGAERPAADGRVFDNVGPRDGRILNQVAAADARDVDAAVVAARRAFEDGRWRNTDRVLGYLDIARDGEADILMGGRQVRQETGGFYLEPTILDNLRPGSRLASEEIFGPVLSVIPFEDEDDALRIANDTVYGLGSGLWTADINRALRLAKRIRAGMVWVNGWDSDDFTMPFGGFGQSGFGRDRSLHALHKYADLKATTISIRQR